MIFWPAVIYQERKTIIIILNLVEHRYCPQNFVTLILTVYDTKTILRQGTACLNKEFSFY